MLATSGVTPLLVNPEGMTAKPERKGAAKTVSHRKSGRLYTIQKIMNVLLTSSNDSNLPLKTPTFLFIKFKKYKFRGFFYGLKKVVGDGGAGEY